MSCCHPGTLCPDYQILLQSFYSKLVCCPFFSFHMADPDSVVSVAKSDFKVSQPRNCLFRILSSRLRAVLRPLTSRVRLNSSASGMVKNFIIKIG